MPSNRQRDQRVGLHPACFLTAADEAKELAVLCSDNSALNCERPVKLEKSDDQLQSYARNAKLTITDEKTNADEENLRSIQKELSAAEADGMKTILVVSPH